MEKKLFLKSIFLGVLPLGVVFALGFLGYQGWQNSYFQVVNLGDITAANLSLSLSKPQSSVLFTGDMMLDRGVEYQIEKHGDWFYPFSKIKLLLSQADMAVGNLEGPIVSQPPKFPDHSLRFAFSPEVVSSLAKANFQLLSLANNHTENMGEGGWQETKDHLQQANIDSIGHPVKCDQDSSIVKGPFVFLAFNKTFPVNCSDEKIVQIVQETRQSYPDKFLVVIFHWGNEYALKSSAAQQSLAHETVKAGADLILGSHPHVVQEIEEYQGRLIFYSLGNFIFDQYFSQETQEGLIVGLKLYPQKVVYQLFATQGNLSQPSVILGEDRENFLDGLAQRSASVLSSSIKKGKIELDRVSFSADKDQDAAKNQESLPTSASQSSIFSNQVNQSSFAHLPGQLVSHLYNIEGVPNVKGLAFRPEGTEVWGTLLLNKTRGATIFDVQAGKNLTNINLENGGGVEVVLTEDGRKAYISQMETGKIFEIDTASRKILRVFNSGGAWTKVLILSKDEKTLLASNWVGNNVSVINLESGELERTIPTVKTPRGIYLTEDQQYLYVAGFANGEIEKINFITGQGQVIFKSGGAMRHIVADKSKNILFFSDMGKDIIWKLNLSDDQVEEFVKTDHNPNTIVLSPDKKILFVSCRGINYSADNYSIPGPEWGSVLLFDAETGQMLDAIVGGNQPTALAISPDGQKLIFSDFLDQKIEVYQIPDYQILKEGNGGISKTYQSELIK